MDIEDLKKPGESGFPIAFEQAMSILMNEIMKLVEPECRVTILIRHPEHDDRDICWTMDDLHRVREMIFRCEDRQDNKDAADIKIPEPSFKIDGILGVIEDD